VRLPREGSRDAPDNKKKGHKMKLNLKQSLGLVIVSCLGLAGSALAAGNGNGAGNSMGGSRGNSSFGMSQRTDLSTGPGNSSFGRTTSENARLNNSTDADDRDDQDTTTKTKKMKKAKHTWSSYPGNSAFGRNQRINHLKGSGNNAYGKTTSANAKAKHLNKKND
jgi:hypothetical protein